MNIVDSLFAVTMSLSWLTLDQAFALPSLLAEVSLLTRYIGYIGVGLQVAAGLGFVIFVHELGHFLAAKTFGVKCEKFYIGFDVPISIGPIKFPRTLGRFRWGETEYGIGIVPLGGYVKMLGQDDDPRNAEAEAERVRQGEGPDATLDPRSYQAKAVWQRMIIISAGVIMNVIFAVVLAACAFLYGVPYEPTTIGSLPAGSPGWQSGLQVGDRVMQIARMKADDPYLRFEEMGSKTVFHGLWNGATPIPFTVDRDGARIKIDATPTASLNPDGFFLVGINPAMTTTLGADISYYSYLHSKNVDLKAGDRIIAVDGEALPVDPDSGAILSFWMTDKFQANWNKPVELTVLRDAEGAAKASGGKPAATPTELKVTLPAVPVKTLGMGFGVGPISAIRKGSLAETAGLNVGDILQKIDGQEIVDALQLPMQVAEKINKPIEFTLRRPGTIGKSANPKDTQAGASQSMTAEPASETLTFTLESKDPASFGSIGNYSAQLSLENFGIAYSVKPIVTWVDPDSAKATTQVAVGDELTQIQFEATPEELKEYASHGLKPETKAQAVTALRTMPTYLSSFQGAPEGLKVRCFLKRDNKVREVVLPIYYAKDWYWAQRGVSPKPLQKIQQTEDIAQAFRWGFSETVDDWATYLSF